MAVSVARFTVAVSTPGVLLRNRSMRLTQLAQVIPSIGSWTSTGVGGTSATVPVMFACILPGSIPPGSARTARIPVHSGRARLHRPAGTLGGDPRRGRAGRPRGPPTPHSDERLPRFRGEAGRHDPGAARAGHLARGPRCPGASRRADTQVDGQLG